MDLQVSRKLKASAQWKLSPWPTVMHPGCCAKNVEGFGVRNGPKETFSAEKHRLFDCFNIRSELTNTPHLQ